VAGLGAGGLSGFITLLLGSGTLTAATRAGEAVKSVSPKRIAGMAALVFALFLAALLSLADQQLVHAARAAAVGTFHLSIPQGLVNVTVEAALAVIPKSI
jgi:hypothetical protein